MKIAFVSNYYNHHQSELSNALYELTQGNYAFIQTMPMEEERISLGWGAQKAPPFVYRSYGGKEHYQKCLDIINDADIVIAGSAPERMLWHRKKLKKPIFRYSERLFKRSSDLTTLPLRAIRSFFHNNIHHNIYLLCASAFAAFDYARIGSFKNKAYKWGYFPRAKKYENISELIDNKKSNSLIWVGRFIELKHPEKPLILAERLKRDGYDFTIQYVGVGVLEEKMKQLAREKSVDDMVEFLGSMSPAAVREHMEKSQIFLFTSDQNEGWGAVLNEAMNSGCAVVASHLIGSVPFLIKDKCNGLIFKNDDLDDLYSKVKFLLDNREVSQKYGLEAYHTITNTWNAWAAAEEFMKLGKSILNHTKDECRADGPCAKAEILKNDWI